MFFRRKKSGLPEANVIPSAAFKKALARKELLERVAENRKHYTSIAKYHDGLCYLTIIESDPPPGRPPRVIMKLITNI
jgi:hypothetical protein